MIKVSGYLSCKKNPNQTIADKILPYLEVAMKKFAL